MLTLNQAPTMLLNIPEEVLLNNYLQNDIKIIFYPFYFVHNIILSSKFIIKDNFIYPIGNKFNIMLGLLLAVLFVSFIYFDMYSDSYTVIYKGKKILAYLMYLYSLANYFQIVAVFILNIIHNKNNVLLVLSIQTLNEDINIGETCKMDFVIWNWISYLSIVCVELLLIIYDYIYYFTDYINICLEVLNIKFALNFIYVVRLITLLKIYMMKFHKKYLAVENHQGRDKAKVFNTYQQLIQTYTLWRKISHVLVIKFTNFYSIFQT